jgi:hypothetical protein
VEPGRYLLENRRGCLVQCWRGVRRKMGKAFVKLTLSFDEELEDVIWHEGLGRLSKLTG